MFQEHGVRAVVDTVSLLDPKTQNKIQKAQMSSGRYWREKTWNLAPRNHISWVLCVSYQPKSWITHVCRPEHQRGRSFRCRYFQGCRTQKKKPLRKAEQKIKQIERMMRKKIIHSTSFSEFCRQLTSWGWRRCFRTEVSTWRVCSSSTTPTTLSDSSSTSGRRATDSRSPSRARTWSRSVRWWDTIRFSFQWFEIHVSHCKLSVLLHWKWAGTKKNEVCARNFRLFFFTPFSAICFQM